MRTITLILLLGLLLGGCGKAAEAPCRIAVGVEVVYQQHGEELQRTYVRQESIRSVLNYLRLLKPKGPVIPEAGEDGGCRITVHYLDGTSREFLQWGNTYLQKSGGDWKKIDTAQAQLLYPLLLLLPSDA